MNTERFSVNNGEDWITINSCAGPVGVAIAAYSLKRPISWVEVKNCSPWAKHIIVNDTIHVYQHAY